MKHSPIGQSSYWFLLLVVMVLLLGAGLRSYHLGTQPLSREEGTAIYAAVHSLADTAEEGAYPPGYQKLLMVWQMLAGRSEFALRLCSVLIGILTVALVYRLGASLFNRPTGLLAAVAIGISPIQVYYGQDATQSALIGLLSMASLYLTHSILTIPSGRQIGRLGKPQMASRAAGYVITNATGLYTHFSLFALLIVAETLIFLLWLSQRSHRPHGAIIWTGLQLVTLILFIPWLPIAIRQLAYQGRLIFDLVSRLKDIVYGFTLPAEAAQNGLIPMLLLSTFGLFPPVDHEPSRTRFVERICLFASGLVVPLVALAWGRNAHVGVPDFLLPANLALMVLASRGLVLGYKIGKPLPALGQNVNSLMHLVVFLMAGFSLLPILSGLQHLYADPSYARDDYRSIAARIRAEAGSQAAVILDTPEQLGVFAYYYPEGENILTLPNEETDETLASLISGYRRIYTVFWDADAQGPDQVVEETLKANAIVASTDQYGSVRLAIYAVTGQPAAKPQTTSGARFGTSIILDGFALSAATLGPGEGLGVTLFWHTNAPLEKRYKVFVHLYGPDGALVTQHDSEPANFTAPTDGWLPRQTVIDYHGILISSAPPGTYTLMVGMYDPAADRLPISSDSKLADNRLSLAEITIP